MKPIEKYREKFTELLKEAEEELGDYLTIKVSSKPKVTNDSAMTTSWSAYKRIEGKEYDFELHTNSFVF